MTKTPPSPHVSIGRISVSGVDAGTARSLGPAIERALGRAARQGALQPGRRSHLRLDLPAGATSRDIAAALARALEE